MVEVAGIFIYHKDDVLLFKRSNKVRYNGSWSAPGGHIEHNESAADAAKRETFEETMIMISGPIKMIGKFDDGKGKKRYALFAKELDSKVEPVIDDEHSDWGWFNKDNLPSPLAPFIIHGIGEIYAR
tara:strand:- start:35 stop:415 length:381 start_codon:yes stop_codon:yes gene_type:complete